ncbi:transcriptional regulator, LysR family [Marinobacter daqiaonensis]|uniref:Transcriptional regulator, LysR family n=1 Tax=Marinobacter daqiaonensis TaxID=650891 RepID=A0A1I6HI13_9GAMM|nr:LysR family transcriptional regulator [Marinobacter daqiaonensis]SFR54122.1 transcriptional regulator, LysR family [Marinobacter daqiaonensis]
MHWDDLRVFLAVAREGSITGGARRLNVQHSTVSRRLMMLEKSLGTRLLERKSSGYELTDAGAELQRSVSRIEMELIAFEGAMGNQESQLAGDLHVSAINNMASSVLMPLFARFSKTYPDIKLHVQVSNKYVSLADRQADVAIRLTNTPLDTLIGARLTTVASAVYGSKTYLAGLTGTTTPPRWLGVDCCDFHHAWTDKACPTHDHCFFVDDTLLTVAALEQGLGLAYLPCFMGDCNPLLARFSAPEPEHDLGLWLLYHPDLRESRRVRVFRDHMKLEVAAQTALFLGALAAPAAGG